MSGDEIALIAVSTSAALLFVAFLILRLAGVVTWSWWWVTAPIWGTLLVAFVLFCAVWFLFIKHIQ